MKWLQKQGELCLGVSNCSGLECGATGLEYKQLGKPLNQCNMRGFDGCFALTLSWSLVRETMWNVLQRLIRGGMIWTWTCRAADRCGMCYEGLKVVREVWNVL